MPRPYRPTALALALVAISGSAVSAAPRAAAPPKTAAAESAGPVVPGVCLLSLDAVYANSKLGQAANARFTQLATQIQSELQTARTPLETDARALDSQKATLSAAAYKQRQQALSDRAQAYQTTVDQRSRQLQATRNAVVGRVLAQAQPIITQTYASHGCGLLIRRETVLSGNMANDLTPAVVQGLDARATTITFDLEPPAASSPAPAR